MVGSLALASLHSQAQFDRERPQPQRGSRIINDTLKQVYGPTTSKYFYESDVFYNRDRTYTIDTIIHNKHRYTDVQKQGYRYQDLGNIGTAMNPIFYTSPTGIGARSGFESLDIYWKGDDSIRYYDTKSPYSNLGIILGGKGRSVTDVSFSRNINPRWNFGFDFRFFAIDKQVQRTGKGDRNAKRTYYDFYTTYQSMDSSYRLFVNYARAKHAVIEFGGVQVDDESDRSDYFDDNRRPYLTDAQSGEYRKQWHLYHQYEVRRPLQFYHRLDIAHITNEFIDDPDAAPDGYYDFVEVDSAETHDQATFRTVRNEVGLKGSLFKLFYNGYYALRNYSMDYKYIQEDTLSFPASRTESYLGGRMELALDSVFTLTGWAEVMDNGNFRIEGGLMSRWLEASVKQNRYEPSFVQQAYRGSHDVWDYDFGPIDISNLSGFLHYRNARLHVAPGISLTRFNNFVFFKEDPEWIPQKVLPVQSTGSQVLVSPELKFTVHFGHLQVSGDVTLNTILENADDALQLPDVFANGQVSYANIFFKQNLDMQIGLDVHWQSEYYALGYDVPTQQFYNQRSFLSPAFPLVDVFFNAKIKRARIFVRYNNLVQMITKDGYFPTPRYPGLIPVLDFGFDWSFYD